MSIPDEEDVAVRTTTIMYTVWIVDEKGRPINCFSHTKSIESAMMAKSLLSEEENVKVFMNLCVEL